MKFRRVGLELYLREMLDLIVDACKGPTAKY